MEEQGWTIIRFFGSRIKDEAVECASEVARVMGNHEECYSFIPIEVTSVSVEECVRPKHPIAYHFEVEEDKSYVSKGFVSHNCALLNFRFEDEFGPDIAEASVLKEQKNLLKKKENPEERKDKVSFSDEGIAQTQTAVPDFVPQEAIIKKNKEKNVLVF